MEEYIPHPFSSTMKLDLNSANSQNNRNWSTENSVLIHKVPLHDVKVGVWVCCAVNVIRIIATTI